MRRSVIVSLAALLVTACGSDATDAQQEAIAQQRAAEIEQNKALEAARQQTEAAGQAFVVGPIEKAAEKDPRAIVDASLELMGGRQKVGAIKTLTARAVLTGATNRTYNLIMGLPDKMLADFVDTEGQVTSAMLVTGTKAYNLTRGHVVDLVSPSLTDALLSIRGDPLCLMAALAVDAARLGLTYLGQADVAGRRADAIAIERQGAKEITAYFDAKTHQLIGTRYRIAQGLVTVIDEQLEQIDGVLLGVTSKQIIGSSVTNAVVSDLKLNPELPAGAFDAMQHPLIR